MKMNFVELTHEEIRDVLAHVPHDILALARRENVVIAGGVVRDTIAKLPVKDIDIFCHSREQAERLALLSSPFVHHTTFAYSVEVAGAHVQFIFYKEFETPEELIGQFDFRACCAGVYFDASALEWRSTAVQGFEDDCRTRRLLFLSQPKDSGKLTPLARALHFVSKGWTIDTNELSGIVTHWSPIHDREAVKRSFRPAYGGR